MIADAVVINVADFPQALGQNGPGSDRKGGREKGLEKKGVSVGFYIICNLIRALPSNKLLSTATNPIQEKQY